ncbi:hypothetical protein GCM10010201_09420 [Pilimelia columellifera subsp. columellifera]|uniref:VCBS repeat-containing protein n=1 Tax=Pilimelia columellifera subsp. columellifera TaxID=706583 RepID=A0ABN3N6A8_9ACTN
MPTLPRPAAPSSGPSAPCDCDDEGVDIADPKLASLVALVEQLTGQKVRVLDPADLTRGVGGVTVAQPPSAGGRAHKNERPPEGGRPTEGPRPQGWGVDYQLTEQFRDHERAGFAAAGCVTTTDGRQIRFVAKVTMERQTVATTDVRIKAGDALIDPLALNFGDGPIGLTASRIDFDLDADGVAEKVSFVAGGNGFLVLDANGNGRADDGRELFGPTTGAGFAELAEHDLDGNGWIDEADPVFTQLRIWDDADGGLVTLAERGVGAIGLTSVATPFHLEAGGRTAGIVRSTGVWLGEDGSAATISQIDLVA